MIPGRRGGMLTEVWDTLGNVLSNRLQKLQNRAARVVLGMSNDIPGSEALDMLGWEPRFYNSGSTI